MKVYKWSSQGIYDGELDLPEDSPLPDMSTLTRPPELEASQTAVWHDDRWVRLDSVPPAPEPDSLPEIDWLPLIAARRYQAEISGIELQDMQVATDDRSKLLINGAALRASRDTAYMPRWKTESGFIDLSSTQVLAMADAVADHIQSCFDREAELQAAVADGSITLEMLEQGWP